MPAFRQPDRPHAAAAPTADARILRPAPAAGRADRPGVPRVAGGRGPPRHAPVETPGARASFADDMTREIVGQSPTSGTWAVPERRCGRRSADPRMPAARGRRAPANAHLLA